MKKNLTEIVCILDKSGSMSGLEKDTIGGYNAMLEKQKKEDGYAYISTILFSDYSKVIHDRTKINDLIPLTEEEYYVDGCTALLDAIGNAIKHIKNVHKYLKEEDRPEKTLFIITTDGQENSSKIYSYEKVKRMVEKQKEKYGWKFIFLRANIDSIAEASRLGIHADRAVNFNCDKEGIAESYMVLSETFSCVRRIKDDRIDMVLGQDWKKDIEDYYKKRHK